MLQAARNQPRLKTREILEGFLVFSVKQLPKSSRRRTQRKGDTSFRGKSIQIEYHEDHDDSVQVSYFGGGGLAGAARRGAGGARGARGAQ
ncbi:hypothetical protein EVAR_31782_1 [Eumeta japonica]|uniref:Uncharacterized protein n=1 Tax=Eumeta variegata TaxID=151549 RepID=A0A4C1W2Z1_EUMVA|nr:hypothetical protein EVAR_31782_1 [Eumeta japonica]